MTPGAALLMTGGLGAPRSAGMVGQTDAATCPPRSALVPIGVFLLGAGLASGIAAIAITQPFVSPTTRDPLIQRNDAEDRAGMFAFFGLVGALAGVATILIGGNKAQPTPTP